VRQLCALTLVTFASSLAAAAPEQRRLSTTEIETWLEKSSEPAAEDLGADDLGEAPPPPPRHHGIFVESGLGMMGHLGPLKNISPVSPVFSLRAGFEPLSFLLLFGEGELSIANTSYGQPPPPPRTYRLYAFGGGARLTLPIAAIFGAFAEGSFGFARVSEDVLSVYGYRDAHELNPYIGGRLGLEWYPVNPHLALGLAGGVRSYSAGLSRARSSDPALSWSAGPAISYRF
jgi:hypothetical protein